MKKIHIYEPAMCCPTGLCGPSIDPELLRMSFVMNNLKKQALLYLHHIADLTCQKMGTVHLLLQQLQILHLVLLIHRMQDVYVIKQLQVVPDHIVLLLHKQEVLPIMEIIGVFLVISVMKVGQRY